jgi:hypothetical protein
MIRGITKKNWQLQISRNSSIKFFKVFNLKSKCSQGHFKIAHCPTAQTGIFKYVKILISLLHLGLRSKFHLNCMSNRADILKILDFLAPHSCQKFETSFFLMLALLRRAFFDHLLWPIFQSSLHIHILQITVHRDIDLLWAAFFMHCINTCLSDLWVAGYSFMVVLLLCFYVVLNFIWSTFRSLQSVSPC